MPLADFVGMQSLMGWGKFSLFVKTLNIQNFDEIAECPFYSLHFQKHKDLWRECDFHSTNDFFLFVFPTSYNWIDFHI